MRCHVVLCFASLPRFFYGQFVGVIFVVSSLFGAAFRLASYVDVMESLMHVHEFGDPAVKFDIECNVSTGIIYCEVTVSLG
jgi:hypothetical protein